MSLSIFLNDIGTLVNVNVGTDISGATVHRIKYVKPDGTSGFWEATISNSQYLQYITIDGDLDQIGEWIIQALITTVSGTWHGEIARFKVLKPIS